MSGSVVQVGIGVNFDSHSAEWNHRRVGVERPTGRGGTSGTHRRQPMAIAASLEDFPAFPQIRDDHDVQQEDQDAKEPWLSHDLVHLDRDE